MKAILIKQQMIDDNNLSQSWLNTIQEFGILPNVWKGTENVQNKYAQRTSLHELDGFFPVVYPPKTDSQKYDELILSDFNNILDQWDVRVINLSPSEIEIKKLNEISIKLGIYLFDGHEYFRTARNMNYKIFQDGDITANQLKEFTVLLLPVYSSLSDGFWDIALDQMNNIPTPVIPALLFRYNDIIADIQTYISSNY